MLSNASSYPDEGKHAFEQAPEGSVTVSNPNRAYSPDRIYAPTTSTLTASIIAPSSSLEPAISGEMMPRGPAGGSPRLDTPKMSSKGGNHSLGLQQPQQTVKSATESRIGRGYVPMATSSRSSNLSDREPHASSSYAINNDDQEALHENRGRSPTPRPSAGDLDTEQRAHPPIETAPTPVISEKKDRSPLPDSITQKRMKVVRTTNTPLTPMGQSYLPSESRIKVIRSQSPTPPRSPKQSPKLDYSAKISQSSKQIKVIRTSPTSQKSDPINYAANRSHSPNPSSYSQTGGKSPTPSFTASTRSQSPKVVDYSADLSHEKRKGRTPILTVDSNLVSTARKPAPKSNSHPPTYDSSNLKESGAARISVVRSRAANPKGNSPPPSGIGLEPFAHRSLATEGKARAPPTDSVITARGITAPTPSRRHASNDKFRAPPNGSNAMKRPPPLQDSKSSDTSITDNVMKPMMVPDDEKARAPPSNSVITARGINAPTPTSRRHASNDKFRAPPNGSNTMKRPPPLQDSYSSDTTGVKDHANNSMVNMINPMVVLNNDEKGRYNHHDGSGSASSMPDVRRRDIDPDDRFVSLFGPQHHQVEDEDDDDDQELAGLRHPGEQYEDHEDHEDHEESMGQAVENASKPIEPGAFAISRESAESLAEMNHSFSTKSTGSNHAPFQVEAMLVAEGTDPPDIEALRREILGDAVEADAVDVNQIRRKRRCRIVFTLLVAICLVVGLSVGLSQQSGNGSIVVIEQTAAPTVTASDSPSAAPTIFTIALCSPFVFVENVELYLGGFASVVQDLNDNGMNITLEEMDICAPQSLSAFNIAIDRYNANIILESQAPPGGNGGSGGNNPVDGPSPPSPPSPPQNRRKLLSTLDNNVLLFRYALGVLFFSTGGENWEHNDNWLNGTNADYCDNWEGIICEFGGSLLNIDLSDNELQGTIPTEIALFVDLERLRLDDNELRGPLPSEMGLLSNLLYLDFQENILTGEIPGELGELTRLDHLNGRENQFTGTLNPALSQLTLLEFFGFERNNLNGTLPTEIGLMTELESLNLGRNNFSGTLPSELDQLTRLIEVFLDQNNFTGQLPENLFRLERIVEMTLEGNALTGSLPQLSGLLRVRKLNFGSNFFTSTIPSGSADDVILDDLRELTMRDNLLTGHIPTELGLAPRLRELRAEGNKLSGFIPSELGALSRLTHMGLENNLLQGFPSTLGQLTNLERLLLSGNPLNATIPTEIGKMVQLIDVEVNDALVRGSFVSELGLLPRLSSLRFDNNLLTGAPPLITSANFAFLSASNNLLAGPLPPLSVILHSENVNLFSNLLTGTIPTEYGALQAVKTLNLGDNLGIIGTIPSELAELRTLERLFLQGTSLTGSVPKELCDLKAVTGIVIDVNGSGVRCDCCMPASDAGAANNGDGNP